MIIIFKKKTQLSTEKKFYGWKCLVFSTIKLSLTRYFTFPALGIRRKSEACFPSL